MTAKRLEFSYEKETKGTFRFQETKRGKPVPYTSAVIRTIYMSKRATKWVSPPSTIHVTVEYPHEAAGRG